MKSTFFGKINKTDKPLAKLTRRNRREFKLIRLEVERDIIIDIVENHL